MATLEVRELIIKASVSAAGPQPGGQAGGGGNSGGASDNNGVSPNEEMINTCIEKILEILRDKHER